MRKTSLLQRQASLWCMSMHESWIARYRHDRVLGGPYQPPLAEQAVQMWRCTSWTILQVFTGYCDMMSEEFLWMFHSSFCWVDLTCVHWWYLDLVSIKRVCLLSARKSRNCRSICMLGFLIPVVLLLLFVLDGSWRQGPLAPCCCSWHRVCCFNIEKLTMWSFVSCLAYESCAQAEFLLWAAKWAPNTDQILQSPSPKLECAKKTETICQPLMPKVPTKTYHWINPKEPKSSVATKAETATWIAVTSTWSEGSTVKQKLVML